MSKKWLNIFCCLLLILTLTACNTQAASSEENNTSESSISALLESEDSSQLSSSRQENSFAETQLPSPVISYDSKQQKYYEREANKLYYNLVHPLFWAGITFDTWDGAEQIPADKLVTFYQVQCLYETYPDTWTTMTVLAKAVEPFIQNYFDVSTEHLQQAEYYDMDSRTYWFGYGMGGGATFEITDIKKDDRILTISLIYITAEKPFRKSELKIDLSNGVRYLSCKAEDIQ